MITSIENAEHYQWGNNCDGWHLLKSSTLSVIQERMPAGTAEQYHFHQKAQQLFYILQGTANFIINEKEFTLTAGESLHIPALVQHCVRNSDTSDLHFLVISEPKSHGDRVNLS